MMFILRRPHPSLHRLPTYKHLAVSPLRLTLHIRTISVNSSMETVKNVAERMAGTAANGYHQSDVTDLSGRVSSET